MSVTEEIKQRIDIVELIGRYTPLKKAGSVYKGLCPFHNERTPSFVVYPNSGNWHCFGACGVGGDVFSFVMRKENLDFRETLELLAKEAGVDLERADDDPHRRQRAGLYTANQEAAAYFQSTLRHHPAAQPARAYLERRGIDAATAERFQLGYAPDSWDSLRSHLLAKGFTVEDLLTAGLLKRSEERGSTYDAFRHRLMIPIRDRQGRTIGFGGRVLDDSVPKYLNTAETPLFHKSHVIYGLDFAHRPIADGDRVVIVEGYMDVIAAHQHGFADVVACMGTALTPEQLQQLQRYTSNFVLALDADAAGQAATIRGLNQARQALARVSKPTVTPDGRVQMRQRLGANLFIASMPAGQDPDDVIRRTPEQWRTLVQQAAPLVDFYFSVVAGQQDLETAQGKAAAVSELAALIAELGDDVERQHYVQQLARLVKVDERTIDGRVQAAARTLRATGGAQRPARPPLRSGKPAVRPPGRTAARQPDGQQDAPPPDLNGADFGPGFAPDFGPPPHLDDTHLGGAHLDEAVLLEAELFAPVPPAQHRRPAAKPDQEEHLLANLLRSPDLLIWLVGAAETMEIAPPQASDFQHVENQEIFRGVKRYLAGDEPWDPELLQDELDEHLHPRLGRLMAYAAQLPDVSERALREDAGKVFLRMRIDRLRARSVNLKFLLDEAQRSAEAGDVREHTRAYNQIARDLRHLQEKQGQMRALLFDNRRSNAGLKLR